MVDVNGKKLYAIYHEFKVSNKFEKYKLNFLGDYNGTAGQCLGVVSH